MHVNSLQNCADYSKFPAFVSNQTRLKALEYLKPQSSSVPVPVISLPQVKKISRDVLSKELDQILHIPVSRIQQKLKEFEANRVNEELTDAILEAETWSYESIEIARSIIEEGIVFLDSMLPDAFLKQTSIQGKVNNVGTFIALGSGFLGALNLGSHHFVLTYRAKILEQSRKLLEEFKRIYSVKFTSLSSGGLNYSSEEYAKIQQKLDHWENKLKTEEEVLRKKQLESQFDTISYLLSILSIPFTYMVKECFLKYGSKILSAFSCFGLGLDVIVAGMELKKSKQETRTIGQWAKKYNKWLDRNLSVLKKRGSLITQASLPIQNVSWQEQGMLQKKSFIESSMRSSPIFDKKIEAFKKQGFVREMQQLLWKEMQKAAHSPDSIKECLEKWGFFNLPIAEKNQPLLQAFKEFQDAHDSLLNVSEKREAWIKALHGWVQDSSAMDDHFHIWWSRQSKEVLIKQYVDHQHSVENVIKNSLKGMVQKKYEQENQLSRFKLSSERIRIGVATITLAVSVSLAILGVLSIPFGGAGLVLLAVSVGSLSISLGLLGSEYYYNHLKKPRTTNTLSLRYQVKMMGTRVQLSINHYFHQIKEKRLIKAAQTLYILHSAKNATRQKEETEDYGKVFQHYQKAKSDFEASQKQIVLRTRELEKLERYLAQKSWEDFMEKALKIQNESLSLNILSAFQEAFKMCDLQLLDEETRTVLEIYLGIDLETLQKSPLKIKNMLQDFFALDRVNLASFIKNQEARMKIYTISDKF